MTKKDVQERVIYKGKKLPLNKFKWSEKTRKFSCDVDDIEINFEDIENCYFEIGNFCDVKTGAYCYFVAGNYCRFETKSHCDFSTGSHCFFKAKQDCTFTTSYGCYFKTHGYNSFNTENCCRFEIGCGCVLNIGYLCWVEAMTSCTIIKHGRECQLTMIDTHGEEKHYYLDNCENQKEFII